MAPKPKDKPKPSPSPSQPPPSIEDLFSSLSKHIQRSDFAQAAKLSDQGPILTFITFFNLFYFIKFLFFFFFAVLAIAPGDEDAIRCKVVALIKDDKIEDALSTIQSSQNVPIDFNFLKVHKFRAFISLI
jgi:signal recognition particle subunit SRP72